MNLLNASQVMKSKATSNKVMDSREVFSRKHKEKRVQINDK